MFRIYPYKAGSASVKKLKTALDAKLIKLENSNYRPKDDHLVINWGNSHPSPVLEGANVINQPGAVAIAGNKLLTLQCLLENGLPTVEFTADKGVAEYWSKVFVRNKLTGHSGEGIEVVSVPARDVPSVPVRLLHLQDAPLYTRGVENHGEYRVHVFDGDVILYQKKSRRVDEEGEVITAEGEEADVRNLSSNWIYRTGNLERLERIEDLAICAVQALGLDFGAVDIIKNEEGWVSVLEVNTAPGLGNDSTLLAYVEAFKSLC